MPWPPVSRARAAWVFVGDRDSRFRARRGRAFDRRGCLFQHRTPCLCHRAAALLKTVGGYLQQCLVGACIGIKPKYVFEFAAGDHELTIGPGAM